MCPASSPQSKLLVDDLVDILIKTEQGKRARKADDMAAFRNGVSLITGNLLIAMEVKEASWSYHALSPAAFNERPIRYKTFRSIIQAMEKASLIELSLGSNAKGVQFEGMTTTSYYPSLATRFKPTMRLMTMAKEATIVEEGASKHFLQQLPQG